MKQIQENAAENACVMLVANKVIIYNKSVIFKKGMLI